MKDTERVFRNDPVLKEVMRKHHLQWIDFVSRGDGTHYLPYSNNIRPAIEFTFTDQTVHMRVEWNAGGKRVRYEVDDEGAIITVTDTVLPDATLAGLSGKPASRVIAVTGFEDVVIEQAVLSRAFAGDPLDLRMSVNPIEREAIA